MATMSLLAHTAGMRGRTSGLQRDGKKSPGEREQQHKSGDQTLHVSVEANPEREVSIEQGRKPVQA